MRKCFTTKAHSWVANTASYRRQLKPNAVLTVSSCMSRNGLGQQAEISLWNKNQTVSCWEETITREAICCSTHAQKFRLTADIQSPNSASKISNRNSSTNSHVAAKGRWPESSAITRIQPAISYLGRAQCCKETHCRRVVLVCAGWLRLIATCRQSVCIRK